MKSIFNMRYLFLVFSMLPLLVGAQTTLVDSLSNDLFKASNRYMEQNTEYRVVQRSVLDTYFDEIKSIDEKNSSFIDKKAKEILSLKETISTQQADYDALNNNYQHVLKVNDGIEFLGMIIPKKQYNIIVWSLIGILIAIILVVLMMYRKNLIETRFAKAELDEKIEEFDAYRQRTLKREQEVASGYVREITKLKEKLGAR